MPSTVHDFTDSEEGEGDSPPPVVQTTRRRSSDRGSPSKPTSTRSNEGHPLRITLRPNLTHLMNNDPLPPRPSSSSHAHLPPSDRSSLSPPPPITLKLGLKSHSATHHRAPSYSSDSDSEVDMQAEAPPHKKPRRSPSKPKMVHPPPLGGAPPGEAIPAHRKAYDWLQPSSAGASHYGPEGRTHLEQQASGSGSGSVGRAPGEEGGTGEGSEPKKRSQKRRGEPGPGKAWRKGIKKGMPIPWREPGGALPDSATPAAETHTAPQSLEGTPEPGMAVEPISRPASNTPVPAPAPPAPREPSPPFVPADAEKLGFPVFQKPIIAPKITLGPFPKVTQFFAPVNGGDAGMFPRKEKVRSWTLTEKTFAGVGGGQLKFKSWARGPPSELGRLIQADKEARDLARRQNKPSANTPVANTGNTTPVPPSLAAGEGGGPLSTTPLSWDRPGLAHRESFETSSNVGGGGGDGDEAGSEMGGDDGEGSIKGEVAPSSVSGSVAGYADVKPAPAAVVGETKPKRKSVGGGGARQARAKPRKSKLAQEIVPSEDASSAIESVL